MRTAKHEILIMPTNVRLSAASGVYRAGSMQTFDNGHVGYVRIHPTYPIAHEDGEQMIFYNPHGSRKSLVIIALTVTSGLSKRKRGRQNWCVPVSANTFHF